MNATRTIEADAAALQERDEFRSNGWLKVIAPAKVNLHLAIGARRDDGYHEAATILHALNLHDVVYLRRAPQGGSGPETRLVACGDIDLPDVSSADNIATKAVRLLAQLTGNEHDDALQVRIEKSIPAQAGLGGGSSNAAAALLGAAALWGLEPSDPTIEAAARQLGSDVAFFLHGGCAYLEGTGEVFVHDLVPMKKPVALVKPGRGVSTAAAYRAFDEAPAYASDEIAGAAKRARAAGDVTPFNNLAPASESLMPELADIREWLEAQQGVEGALLCGSGSTTFAVCERFEDACRIVAEARKRDYWARTTSFGSLRCAIVSP